MTQFSSRRLGYLCQTIALQLGFAHKLLPNSIGLCTQQARLAVSHYGTYLSFCGAKLISKFDLPPQENFFVTRVLEKYSLPFPKQNSSKFEHLSYSPSLFV